MWDGMDGEMAIDAWFGYVDGYIGNGWMVDGYPVELALALQTGRDRHIHTY
jgi:hypothetical protein